MKPLRHFNSLMKQANTLAYSHQRHLHVAYIAPGFKLKRANLLVGLLATLITLDLTHP